MKLPSNWYICRREGFLRQLERQDIPDGRDARRSVGLSLSQFKNPTVSGRNYNVKLRRRDSFVGLGISSPPSVQYLSRREHSASNHETK